jgi:hypothetical protein
MRSCRFVREVKRMQHMPLAELRTRAARNKRLLVNALNCAFRKSYMTRKRLAKLYGDEIARKMRQI